MKLVIAILLALSNFGLYGQGNIYRMEPPDDKEVLQAKSLKSSGAQNNTDIIYQRLQLNINPNLYYISGEVTTYFIPAGAISSVEFDLTDSLSVDSVWYHQTKITFTHSGDVLHINFGGSIAEGAIDSVSVFYQGKPPNDGSGSFVQSKHDSIPIIWTLSEPYGARDWWPCKQNLQDKIDSLDVIITTPDSFRAASNGLLVEEIQAGNNKIYHWRHRYPIATYLVCFAVTNYASFYLYVPFGNDTLPVLNYLYPEDTTVLKSQTELVIPCMQLYDSLFGLYPFSKEKYGQVEFGWVGGMEHQTMTFMGNFGFETIAHELGHHWFGDKVTCASWGDIWLNEGFAVYLSGLCYEHISPEWWVPFKQSRIGGACADPSGALFCYDTADVSQIFSGHNVYAKGAMVLHMLRWKLGDSVFFAGLRSYLQDPSNAYAFASAANLKNHLENESGLNLDNFFNEWVYGRGYPSYQITWSQDFSNHVDLVLGQKQSDPSVAFFDMPVPIKFKSATRDTTLVFNHGVIGQNFSVDLSFADDSLIFDPDYWLISANNAITRQSPYNFEMKVYPNPVSNVLQLSVETARPQQAHIRIFNDLGQVQFNNTSMLMGGDNMLNLDVSKFASGVYRVIIEVPQQYSTGTFVITRSR